MISDITPYASDLFSVQILYPRPQTLAAASYLNLAKINAPLFKPTLFNLAVSVLLVTQQTLKLQH